MKISPKLIFIFTLLFSVAGFFLCYFDHMSGLIGFWVLVGFALLMTLFLRPLEQRASWQNIFSTAPMANIFMLTASLGLLVGNLLLLLSGTEAAPVAVNAPQVIAVLTTVQAPLGLAAAACVATFAISCLFGKKPSALLFMIASIYAVVRLILHFQSWNTDPSVWDYCYQLLAAICAMLGIFQLAGFSFDKGKRRITLFWCLAAIFFCSISIVDTIKAKKPGEIVLNISYLILMLGAAWQLLFCKGAAPMPLPEEENPAEETAE